MPLSTLAFALVALGGEPRFPTLAQAAEAIASGDPASSDALAGLRAKGRRGLWALTDALQRTRGVERARISEAIGTFASPESEWALLKELSRKSAIEKQGAIRGLVHVRSQKAVRAIVGASTSTSTEIRDAVIDALVALAPGLEDKVSEMLLGSSEEARDVAVGYFARRGPTTPRFDEVVVAGLRDPSPLVRLRAIAAALEHPRTAYLPDLGAIARGTDERPARASITAIARNKAPQAVDLLKGIVLDPKASIGTWEDAAIALRTSDDPLAYEALVDGLVDSGARRARLFDLVAKEPSSRDVERLIDLLARPRSRRTETIRLLLDRIGEPAEDRIIADLPRAGESMRRAVAQYLASRPPERIDRKLYDEATRAGSPSRAIAIALLSEIGQPETITRLRALVSDSSPEIRGAVAWALGRVTDPAAEGALIGLSTDPDPTVRAAAVSSLGRKLNRSRIAAAVAALEDADARVRFKAIQVLGGASDLVALRALEKRLRAAPISAERIAIVESIAKSRLPEAGQLMILLVTDRDPEIRRAASKVVADER